MNFDTLRFAVADGATNHSYASHQWAQTLTDSFVEARPDPGPHEKAFKDIFRASKAEWILRRPSSDVRGTLFDKGSLATLIGVNITPSSSGGMWRATSVGDSCLFHLRDDRLVSSFPMVSAKQFNDTPALVSSLWSEHEAQTATAHATGSLEVGDVLLLATDELARWALSVQFSEPQVWAFLALVDQRLLRALIATELGAGRMKRDDITLVRVGLGA